MFFAVWEENLRIEEEEMAKLKNNLNYNLVYFPYFFSFCLIQTNHGKSPKGPILLFLGI